MFSVDTPNSTRNTITDYLPTTVKTKFAISIGITRIACIVKSSLIIKNSRLIFSGSLCSIRKIYPGISSGCIVIERSDNILSAWRSINGYFLFFTSQSFPIPQLGIFSIIFGIYNLYLYIIPADQTIFNVHFPSKIGCILTNNNMNVIADT